MDDKQWFINWLIFLVLISHFRKEMIITYLFGYWFPGVEASQHSFPTAPADPFDDLGVGVGQLRQRASQLLLVSAGVITSERAGHGATNPPPFNPGLCPPRKVPPLLVEMGMGKLLLSEMWLPST